MKNILLSLAVAATLLVGTLATPTTAEARPRWYGGRGFYGYGYRPYYYGNYGYGNYGYRPYYGGYRSYYSPRYYGGYSPYYYGGYPGYYGGYGSYPGYYGYGTGIGIGGMRGGVYIY